MAVDYSEWLAGEYPRILLVVATVYSGASLTTRYLADQTWVTGPGESPANTIFDGRILDETEVERTMGAAFGIGGAAVNGGELVLDNRDGELDDWRDDYWYGHPVIMYFGNPDWAYADIVSEGKVFEGVFRALTQSESDEGAELRIEMQGKHLKLQQPARNVPETTGAIIGDDRPICYGYPKNIEGAITDPDTTPEYHIDEEGPVEDAAVARYINQAASTSPTISKDNTDPQRQIEFNAEPDGLVTFDSKGKKSGGAWLSKMGESLQHFLTRELVNRYGLVVDGTATTLRLDDDAPDTDDALNGDTLRHAVFNADGEATLYESQTVTDYDGPTRTATVGSAWTNTPKRGDGYRADNAGMQAGLLTVAEVDTAAFTQLDADWPYEVGIYPDAGQSVDDLLEQCLGPGAYDAWTRDAKLTVGLVKDPANETPVLALDTNDLHGEVIIEEAKQRLYRLRVGYDRNHTPARGSVAGDLSPDRASWVTREYRYHIKEDLSIRDESPEARSVTINTMFTTGADALLELDRLWDLFSVPRRRYIVQALTKTMAVDVGDVVSLTDTRIDLDDKHVVVQNIVERYTEGMTEMVLWG